MKIKFENKQAQVTIFVIVAIILVAIVAGFFVFRDSFIGEKIPSDVEPIYNDFLICLEEKTLTGIDVLESQAGYIYLPDFEPGSLYMPFSSQLDFLGNQIPYWYYVSGNNIQKEQVPSKENMELQLAEFVEEKISNCIFEKYYEQGFEIKFGESQVKINVKENEVEVDLEMDFAISKGEESFVVGSHGISVNSKLGALYNSAKKIYEEEQENLFLENYAVDTLRLYAPVDGVELTCSPMNWNADEIFDELEEAIEANTLALKVKGGDYSLQNKESEYFVLDIDVHEDVRFINSKTWSNSFEINSDSNILMANPIGNQPGLGILGFCYVPYHFVYNIRYPVLIQVQNGAEIFQFPVAVVVQGNKPREALDVSSVEIGVPELCKYKNTLVEVKTFDTDYNPVEADISYSCSGSNCQIGKTNQGILSENFPQCVNGYVTARAEGFEDARHLYSTTNEGSVEIILDKLYKKNIRLNLDGMGYNNDAIINFVSSKLSKTIVYPEQKNIELSEGQYEIQVYIYENSSIKLEETINEQCIDVPKSGFGGLIGLTQKKCFDVEVPAQIISNALSGGGTENYYILESELINSGYLEINVESLESPKTIEQLQDNYFLFESKGLDVGFK